MLNPDLYISIFQLNCQATRTGTWDWDWGLGLGMVDKYKSNIDLKSSSPALLTLHAGFTRQIPDKKPVHCGVAWLVII